jgi:hypothetical protein
VSFTWAADWRGDDEPRDRHDDLRCPVWLNNKPVRDPEEDCTCRDLDGHTRDFQAGVQEKVDRFESHAGRSS